MPKINNVNELINCDLERFVVIGLFDRPSNSIISESNDFPYLFSINKRGRTPIGTYISDRKNKIGKEKYGIETANQEVLYFIKLEGEYLYFKFESGKEYMVKLGEIPGLEMRPNGNGRPPTRQPRECTTNNQNSRFRGNAIGNAQNLFIRNILSNLGEESFNKRDWKDSKYFFDNKCAYCGGGEENQKLEMEHAIPINKEKLGEHKLGNIVPSCKSCNSSKHSKDYKEFLIDQPEQIEKIESYMEKRDYVPIAGTAYADKIREILKIAHNEIGSASNKYIEIINQFTM
jgi:5-methylcytosine-specific restriction endonuclease McrA